MFIILASTSKSRKKLLDDAGIHAECVSPDYDEKPICKAYESRLLTDSEEEICTCSESVGTFDTSIQ